AETRSPFCQRCRRSARRTSTSCAGVSCSAMAIDPPASDRGTDTPAVARGIAPPHHIKVSGFMAEANKKSSLWRPKRQVRRCHQAGQPVPSVETTKQELVGNYANAGRDWEKAYHPLRTVGSAFHHRGPGRG